MDKNRQVLLASRPNGAPTAENFELAEVDIPRPGENEMLLRTVYLSLDPYMRGRMNSEKSYAEPVPVGGVMEGGTVSVVEQSNGGKFQEGDVLVGRCGWQDYAVSDGSSLSKVDPSVAPISTALGVLGMPGMTAYSGLLRLGKPKEGETVVVAAASGAVGANVGQIAKIKAVALLGLPEVRKNANSWLKNSALMLVLTTGQMISRFNLLPLVLMVSTFISRTLLVGS